MRAEPTVTHGAGAPGSGGTRQANPCLATRMRASSLRSRSANAAAQHAAGGLGAGQRELGRGELVVAHRGDGGQPAGGPRPGAGRARARSEASMPTSSAVTRPVQA